MAAFEPRCVGVRLGRIKQAGHPVFQWAAKETPRKERAAGRGLKIQKKKAKRAAAQEARAPEGLEHNKP